MKKTIKLRSAARDYSLAAQAAQTREDILKNIFLSRGATYGVQNDYSLKHIYRPEHLKGMPIAVDMLAEAIKRDKKIIIVGDFDADGATSTALAMRCLRAFGCRRVDYLVPNRFVFGYGLTPEIVEVAADRRPDVIITVDNGISSIAGVEAAKEKGMQVIITDHHLPAKCLPAADAIVNPNQPGCEFPSKNLAGVGVIFYVMSALRRHLRATGWFAEHHIAEPNLASYLDLVALGTVADVVPLDYNNRVLVAAGLQRMRAGRAAPGIKALLQVAGREAPRLTSSDLGFALGPRLNAAGRLDDMSLGIKCLLSDDYYAAVECARELDDLNRDRKLIEASMQKDALQILEDLSARELETHQHGVCLYQKDWHQGVIGILASRIKDRLHRPTIIFADADDVELKGSGRSIPGVHLRDVLDEIAASHPGLIEKFGGHAMAAGLSLRAERLDAFSRAFNRAVVPHLSDEIIEPIVHSDGQLPEDLIGLDLAQAIRDAGPWGQNFPAPVFHGTFQIVQQRIVGAKHLKMTLTRETYSSRVFDAIAFNVDLSRWPDHEAREITLAYQLDVNHYRGDVNVQLLAVYLAPK